MRAACAFALLAAGAASAHDADLIAVRVERDGNAVRERLTLTPAALLQLAPIDEDGDRAISQGELDRGARAIALGVWDQSPLSSASGPCARGDASAAARGALVELSATFECGEGPIAQAFRVLEVLPPEFRVAVEAAGAGGARSSFADRGQQTAALLGPAAQPAPSDARGLGGWVLLGAHHILVGADHLAFLLAVLLVGGGWRKTLLLVTSFTAAHSITLGATALGVWTLSDSAARWVEVAIAASIVWVALENLLLKRHAHRAPLTFAFGLVHGFGFASVLAGYGFGDSAARALFGFNLGVEVGQAAVVLAVAPLGRLLCTPARRAWAVRVGSSVVLATGAFWFVQRALG